MNKLRNILTAAAIVLLPVAASAATLIVPGAGTGPGANNSQWQSSLTLHSAAPRPVTVSIVFHTGKNVAGPLTVTLAARETVTIADIVKTKFGISAGSGALEITVDDRNLRHLAVNSRTFNTAPEGEFGQDIPAVRPSEAAGAGDIAAITGPSSVATSRFNFGLYAVTATTLTWELVRADGTIAGTADATFAAGEHVQHNNGIASVFGLEAKDNDTVHARVTAGNAIFFGSVINATGDPTFVEGVRTRDDILIAFGVDDDENGTIDFTDADGDGRLDQEIELFTGAFPNYFRIVATGEFGEAVTLQIVSSTSDAQLIDANGTLRTSPFDGLKGQTGEIVVKATVRGSSSLLTIPVRYR